MDNHRFLAAGSGGRANQTRQVRNTRARSHKEQGPNVDNHRFLAASSLAARVIKHNESTAWKRNAGKPGLTTYIGDRYTSWRPARWRPGLEGSTETTSSLAANSEHTHKIAQLRAKWITTASWRPARWRAGLESKRQEHGNHQNNMDDMSISWRPARWRPG